MVTKFNPPPIPQRRSPIATLVGTPPSAEDTPPAPRTASVPLTPPPAAESPVIPPPTPVQDVLPAKQTPPAPHPRPPRASRTTTLADALSPPSSLPPARHQTDTETFANRTYRLGITERRMLDEIQFLSKTGQLTSLSLSPSADLSEIVRHAIRLVYAQHVRK